MLNDKFKELGIGKYQKNMNNIFEILMEYGNLKLAIRYAKRIIKDGEGRTPTEIAPGTKVYEMGQNDTSECPNHRWVRCMCPKIRKSTFFCSTKCTYDFDKVQMLHLIH